MRFRTRCPLCRNRIRVEGKGRLLVGPRNEAIVQCRCPVAVIFSTSTSQVLEPVRAGRIMTQ